MRSVFQQYTQPENQLTHALACTLNEDRTLIRPFLRWAGARDVPRLHDLIVTEQQVPGEYVSGDEDDRRGLPDACVFSEEGWAFLIESKVAAGISLSQLRRHIATSERQGFASPWMLLISVDEPNEITLPHTKWRAWREVYAWFRQRSENSDWARRFTEYMEAFEAQMLSRHYSIRGTITVFDGLRFDDSHPYSYAEGKRLIRLLGNELQTHPRLLEIGADPHGQRRSAITGRGASRVWDYIPLKAAADTKNFTDFPHLTLGIGSTDCAASITVPNGVRGGFRTRLRDIGRDGFVDLLAEIESRSKPVLKQSKGASITAYAMQRHYPSQRSQGIEDAVTRADLRTLRGDSMSGVKHQPQWIDAIYGVLTEKRSNIQFGLNAQFNYKCPVIRSAGCVELFADSLHAMSPLLGVVLGD